MNRTKIKIRNLFGIKEYEMDGSSVELSSKNGTGKTSVLDAIKYALTNKSGREYIVHSGENEGEIIIETDSGLYIDRKTRTNKSDYKSVKRNGLEIGSPEAFLKEIFTPLQLNPIEFMGMEKIKEWFGEIPGWVSYDQNILSVLNDIQADNGDYYQGRRNIDRDIRNKKAFVEDIAVSIPDGYDAEKWRNESAGELYRQIESITRDNAQVEKAKSVIENRDNKVRGFEAEKEIKRSAVERETSERSKQIVEQITRLEGQIAVLRQEESGLESSKADRLALADKKYEAAVAEFEAKCSEYRPYADKEIKDTTELNQKAKTIEDMKSHLNEYDRMVGMQEEISQMQEQSQALTDKIEKARTLPGEILANCTIPIRGLTVENGIPLIHGLPVSNLSEGEKLDLCIDVALQKPNGLNINLFM